jgi:hypothetical protein
MKRLFLILPAFLFMAIIACNNTEKKTEETNDPGTALADSLEKEVEEGHNIAMPKSMKIPNLQKETKRLIDSISKLPAKAKEAAAPYKTKLENLLKDLDNAYSSMDKWMEEFGQRMEELSRDSAKDNLAQRIKFFSEEKIKVDKVKKAVLESLQKADSLIKRNF